MTDLEAMHASVCAHESAHAVAGLLAGVDVTHVSAPPLDLERDLPLAVADPDAPAGITNFRRPPDARARALLTLAGPLADGALPTWPIKPRTPDERELASLCEGYTEFEWLELIRDTRELLAKGNGMHSLISELLQHGVELNELMLRDLKNIEEKRMERMDMERTYQTFPATIRIKGTTDRERDELGVIADSVADSDGAKLRAEAERVALEVDPRHAMARCEWEDMTGIDFDKSALREWKTVNAAFDKAERVHRKSSETFEIETFKVG
jgi:hypothetical protein